MKVRPLTSTAYIENALSVEQSKEVLAHFGLAVHASNVLEHAILNALFVAECVTRIKGFESKADWERNYDAFFEKGYRLSFGQIVNRLRQSNKYSEQLIETLQTCTTVRNNLVHHSQREGAALIFSEPGRSELIASYSSAIALFGVANDEVESEADDLCTRAGGRGHGIADTADRVRNAQDRCPG